MMKKKAGRMMVLSLEQNGKMYPKIGFVPDCGVGKEDFEMVEIG
jgi:hypothetical protein